ncbi:hypothetical protein SAICODRAFT_149414 [Saitoella complicata NRRL Y-17804]|uniref:uncharacterized protein n=1 Tax=Saitoella complicata (strain BCRC 22490 / CBS 7301 / JCM 7358 / NBRC 10748 / NRRL Y-17804) TaxID=698492 RepID=UPI0008674DA9|nr:uncharacterized protein SAICODRAFT_149414 [Saitoella complicata NRRL Y-17804]ODQ55649.1 hypothetical protein SAICODRAFT_149414 [Saitoella complicata NRRL Y-17804]
MRFSTIFAALAATASLVVAVPNPHPLKEVHKTLVELDDRFTSAGQENMIVTVTRKDDIESDGGSVVEEKITQLVFGFHVDPTMDNVIFLNGEPISLHRPSETQRIAAVVAYVPPGHEMDEVSKMDRDALLVFPQIHVLADVAIAIKYLPRGARDVNIGVQVIETDGKVVMSQDNFGVSINIPGHKKVEKKKCDKHDYFCKIAGMWEGVKGYVEDGYERMKEVHKVRPGHKGEKGPCPKKFKGGKKEMGVVAAVGAGAGPVEGDFPPPPPHHDHKDDHRRPGPGHHDRPKKHHKEHHHRPHLPHKGVCRAITFFVIGVLSLSASIMGLVVAANIVAMIVRRVTGSARREADYERVDGDEKTGLLAHEERV